MADNSLVEDEVMEELLALSSIYSAPGELEFKGNGSTIEDHDIGLRKAPMDSLDVIVSLLLTVTDLPNTVRVDVKFMLSARYPQAAPKIEILSSKIKPEITAKLQNDACVLMESLLPEAVLYETVEYCRNYLEEYLSENSQDLKCMNCPGSTENETNLETLTVSAFGSLVLVDHMRNTSSYLKLLKSWGEDLDVTVTVVNCGPHRIYIQLIGREKKSVEAFLKKWRTQCVDVDSHGQPCKERQLKLVSQATVPVESMSRYLFCLKITLIIIYIIVKLIEFLCIYLYFFFLDLKCSPSFLL